MKRKLRQKLKAKGIKVKLRSMKRLKFLAWEVFSEYIRRKDADPDGMTECVACGIKKHWKEIHAAHLVPGRKLGILFDSRGVFPCCYGCNVCKNGNYREYDAYIDREFGQEYRINLIEELRRLSKQPTKWSRDQYEAVIHKYRSLVEGFKQTEAAPIIGDGSVA